MTELPKIEGYIKLSCNRCGVSRDVWVIFDENEEEQSINWSCPRTESCGARRQIILNRNMMAKKETKASKDSEDELYITDGK